MLLTSTDWFQNHISSDFGTGVIGAAIVGGTFEAIGGGKFVNGAATSAFIYAYYLLDEDSVDLPGGPYGHAGALVEVPGTGGYLYHSHGPGDDWGSSADNYTVEYFATLKEAQAALGRYDYALRFEMTEFGANQAIIQGQEYWGEGYWATASKLAYNCTEVAVAILTVGGVELKIPWFHRQSPIKVYNANADRAIGEVVWGIY